MQNILRPPNGFEGMDIVATTCLDIRRSRECFGDRIRSQTSGDLLTLNAVRNDCLEIVLLIFLCGNKLPYHLRGIQSRQSLPRVRHPIHLDTGKSELMG